MPPSFWIVVLIKDFTTAKSRLAPVLDAAPRRRLAEMTAARALDAALALAPTFAVCGSVEAADLARLRGAALVVESAPSGQNPAAAFGATSVVPSTACSRGPRLRNALAKASRRFAGSSMKTTKAQYSVKCSPATAKWITAATTLAMARLRRTSNRAGALGELSMMKASPTRSLATGASNLRGAPAADPEATCAAAGRGGRSRLVSRQRDGRVASVG